MANFQELDLEQLHTAITDTLKAQFPALVTVEAYREETDRKRLPIPALLFELTEWENAPDDDAGTDQLAVLARFEARIIIGFKTPKAKIEIRKMVAALCSFLRLQRWGMAQSGVGHAQVLGAYPDEFDAALDQYEIWRVEWEQLLHFGVNVWAGEGITPTEILYSYEPETGIPNEPKYQPLEIPE